MSKSRTWLAICYPENFIDNWETVFRSSCLGVDYLYIIHDRDKHDNGEPKKTHLHLWLRFPNGSRTQSQVISFLTNILEKDHTKNIFSSQKLPIPDTYGILYAHDYFLHSLETCKLENKFQYDPDSLVKSPKFDFLYNKELAKDKNDLLLDQLIDIVEDKGFTNYSDLFYYVRSNYDRTLQVVARRNFAFLTQLTKGNYLRKIYWDKYIQHSETVSGDPSSLPFDPNSRKIDDPEKEYQRLSAIVKNV